MIIKDSIKNNTQKIIKSILIAFDLFLLIFALSTGAKTMFSGLNNIINTTGALVTDYFVVGGISGAFFNTFLVTTLGLILLFSSKAKLNGVSFASIFMLSGFSLFGKNIMNVIPIMLGVLLYALIFKKHVRSVVYVALFGTALGPIVTEVYLQLPGSIFLKLFVSYLTGAFIGFILTPVSEHALKIHQGFDLYNIGFTDGIVAICFVALLRAFGFKVTTTSMNVRVNDLLFLITLLIFSTVFIILGILLDHDVIRGQIKINKESGRSMADFIRNEGIGATLTNMGLCGLLSTLFMYFANVPLNGPIFGTIISVIGFSACGDNLRNISYIYIASLIGHLTGLWNLSTSIGVALATLLGTGMAPIGGYYGMIAGIISGFAHISLAQITASLHFGLNLYNNGFVAGFVAMFLVPIFNACVRFKEKLRIIHNMPKGNDDESIN